MRKGSGVKSYIYEGSYAIKNSHVVTLCVPCNQCITADHTLFCCHFTVGWFLFIVNIFFHDECRIVPLLSKLAKFCPARDLNLSTPIVWRTTKGLASRLGLSGSRQASLHSFLQYPVSSVMIVWSIAKYCGCHGKCLSGTTYHGGVTNVEDLTPGWQVFHFYLAFQVLSDQGFKLMYP